MDKTWTKDKIWTETGGLTLVTSTIISNGNTFIKTHLKVNSFDLDVEALCDFDNEGDSVALALDEWQLTNSPIVYWYNMVGKNMNFMKRTFNPDFFNTKPSSDIPHFAYGLPLDDAKNMCKIVYKENIAKVTLEILDPKVLQIKKDITATFTDRLGVVGKYKI